MTNLEKWKQKEIEVITKMSVEDVVEAILDYEYTCDYCKHKKMNGDCENLDCRKEMKDYLNS